MKKRISKDLKRQERRERKERKKRSRIKARVKALKPETALLAMTLERRIEKLVGVIDELVANRSESWTILRNECHSVRQAAERVISLNYKDAETRRRLLVLEERLDTVRGDLMSIHHGLPASKLLLRRGS